MLAPQSTALRPVSPLPLSPRKDKSLEASMIESLEVDLGDF